MSVQVLLNLLNKLRKRYKISCYRALHQFHNKFHKFNNKVKHFIFYFLPKWNWIPRLLKSGTPKFWMNYYF